MIIFFLNLIIFIQGLFGIYFGLSRMDGAKEAGDKEVFGAFVVFSFFCCLGTLLYLLLSIGNALRLYY